MANSAKQGLGANFHKVNSSGKECRERRRAEPNIKVNKLIGGRIEISEGRKGGYIGIV